MKALRLIFRIFAGIGLALILAGVIWAVRTQQFVSRAVSAPGVVIGNAWSYRSRSASRSAYPRIRFRTQAGQDTEFVSSFGSSPPSYRVNDSVTVLYNPDAPDRAVIQSFMELWFGPVLLSGLGLIFGSIGFIPMLLQRRTAARDE